jgi:hypothetical protein
MAKDLDWSKANYTWQEADEMEFEDFDDDQAREPWPSKRTNPTSSFSTLHVIDLNKIKDGDDRRMFAVYGVPVGWGTNDGEPDEFEERFEKIEAAEDQGDEAYEACLSSFGFINEEHFEWIRERLEGSEKMAWKQTQDMMDQANTQRIDMQQTAAAADPGLLEAFEGVTVQIWAQAAVALMNTPDEAGQAQALAGLGMDKAKWDRVNTEFQSRMQRDTTGVISTEYGKAFSGAQGIPGGGGAGNVDGSAAQLGGEPVSFEKYSEIAGAQAAWGETGQDVSAMLQQVFGIGVAEISAYGAYWSTKFMADVQLMLKHGELMEKFKEKYMGGAGDMDDDIDI